MANYVVMAILAGFNWRTVFAIRLLTRVLPPYPEEKRTYTSLIPSPFPHSTLASE
jgi:hypothetical protein